MPQLNPAPWFFTFLLVWLILLLLLKPAMTELKSVSQPHSYTTKYSPTTPWTWMWH